MPVLLRRATADDVSAIATIHVRAWQAAYPGIVPDEFLRSLSIEDRMARWRTILEEAASTVFVAEAPEGVVGWISVGRSRDRDATPTTGELWAIYVAPGHWRHGAGQALWDGAKAHLAASGCSDVTVWVLEDNHPARRFYERMGFAGEPDQTRPIEIGGARLPEVRLRGSLGR